MSKRRSKKSTSTNKVVTGSQEATGGTSRTRARRAAREAERRRQRNITIAVGLVIAAVIVAVLVVLIITPDDAPIPEGVADLYEGIPQTFDDNGFAVLGDPNAPVQVIEYASFSCPGCAQWHDNNNERVLDRVRDGVISFTYVPLLTGSVANAEGAARAAICAGQQDSFWVFHDVLFDWHLRFGNQAFRQQRIDAGVEELGLDSDEFSSCRNSSETSSVITAAQSFAGSRGINSTPTFSVQGVVVTQGEFFDRIDTTLENWRASTGLEPIPLDERGGVVDDEEETTPEVTPEITDEAVEATEEIKQTSEAEETEMVEEEMTEEPEETPEAEDDESEEPEETPEAEDDESEESDDS